MTGTMLATCKNGVALRIPAFFEWRTLRKASIGSGNSACSLYVIRRYAHDRDPRLRLARRGKYSEAPGFGDYGMVIIKLVLA